MHRLLAAEAVQDTSRSLSDVHSTRPADTHHDVPQRVFVRRLGSVPLATRVVCELFLVTADNEWEKDWTSPSKESRVSPNMPRPASRSGSASSLGRQGKAAGAAPAAPDASGPNGGSWAGWEQEHNAAPAAVAGGGSATKKDDADDWGKW